MSGVNFAKIRKVFPDVKDHELSGDLERLAEKLDRAEEIEKFVKSDEGKAFRDHFVVEIGRCLQEMFDNTNDYTLLLPKVERLKVLVGFYKMVAGAETNAEALRTMVDEMIEEIS
jgi:hypothetical protein